MAFIACKEAGALPDLNDDLDLENLSIEVALDSC